MLLLDDGLGVSRQAGIGFFECLQYCLLVERKRAIGRRFALLDALTNAAQVEAGPLDARSQRIAFAATATKVTAVGGIEAPAADERDAWEEISHGHTDLGRRCRER